MQCKTQSETIQCGSDGFAVKSVVTDVLDTAAAPTQYTLQGYCALSHVTDFRLDPPRGAEGACRVVFALLTNMLEENVFLAEQFWHLEPNQVQSAVQAFELLRGWAASIDGSKTASKRAASFTAGSPLDVKKARQLGSYPSDPPNP